MKTVDLLLKTDPSETDLQKTLETVILQNNENLRLFISGVFGESEIKRCLIHWGDSSDNIKDILNDLSISGGESLFNEILYEDLSLITNTYSHQYSIIEGSYKTSLTAQVQVTYINDNKNTFFIPTEIYLNDFRHIIDCMDVVANNLIDCESNDVNVVFSGKSSVFDGYTTEYVTKK